MREVAEGLTFEMAIPVLLQGDHGRVLANHIEEKLWDCIDALDAADDCELRKNAGKIVVLRELMSDIDNAEREEREARK
jgi:hypothetical protein